MELNRTELEKLLNGIATIIYNLEKYYTFNKSTKIYLSNGESIYFNITKSSLAHLLGINTNYLASTSIFREKNSYELLKKMCDSSYKIHDLHTKGIINYNELFSKNIYEKLNGFFKNININCEETELVCKYDPSRNYKLNELNEKFDYLIVKNVNGKYYMLCLIKDKLTGQYLPMSNRYFENFEEAQDQLSTLLPNQEVTIMNSAKCDNCKQHFLDDKQKLEKAKNLEDYRRMYGCSIDLTGDYKFILNGAIIHKNNASENYYLVKDMLLSHIRDGKIIDTSLIQDRNLTQISEAFNDFICSKNISGKSDDIDKSYSEMKQELTDLKNMLEKSKELLESLNKRNTELMGENEELKQKNDNLNETVSKVYELVKPQK